jgi:hypothetical protein
MEDCQTASQGGRSRRIDGTRFRRVSREDVEALSNDMGARENPSAGLIAPRGDDTANGVHAVDIRETQQTFSGSPKSS